MFAGETQADVLMGTYMAIPAGVLIATGLVKAMLTPSLINMGWRGGHFFPVIFSGVSLGYGLAILTGTDPVFCVAVCTASIMGAVMRQPVMVVGLLLMCFPLKGIVCMIIAAAIAAGIPLPKPLCKSPGSARLIQTSQARCEGVGAVGRILFHGLWNY